MDKTSSSQIQRPRDLMIIAVLMILFGLAEVVTSFTHDFFGVNTAAGNASTIAGAAVGLLYILSGIFILPLRKWGAAAAIVCLIGDVAGRVAMVATGLYTLDSSRQTFAIILGTVIAAVFAIYIGFKWKIFK